MWEASLASLEVFLWRKAAAGRRCLSFPPFQGALAPRSVLLGLKPSRNFSSAAHFLTLERGAMEASTPLDGFVSSRPFRAPLLATRSVLLGLKPSHFFSSAAHFLTLERGAMEASTPLDAVL